MRLAHDERTAGKTGVEKGSNLEKSFFYRTRSMKGVNTRRRFDRYGTVKPTFGKIIQEFRKLFESDHSK